jgi:hypothetical protein
MRLENHGQQPVMIVLKMTDFYILQQNITINLKQGKRVCGTGFVVPTNGLRSTTQLRKRQNDTDMPKKTYHH